MNIQKSFDVKKPTLYLVATPIGNLQEMSFRAIETLKEVDVIAAEDTRNTKKLLQYFDIHTKCIAHHMHNEFESAKGLVQLLEKGQSIAVVSDAGYPLISDPGQLLVQEVIQSGYPVVPISGSNAMLNALVASGICAQPFLFYGFLDSSTKQRVKALQELKELPYTLIFYEAPHRVKKMLQSCLEVMGNRNICLARELTKLHEEFIRGTITEALDVIDDIRGEIVVVIEASQLEKQALPYSTLKGYIEEYMKQGMSSKEAIKQVAKEQGLSKNDLYRNYHELNG